MGEFIIKHYESICRLIEIERVVQKKSINELINKKGVSICSFKTYSKIKNHQRVSLEIIKDICLSIKRPFIEDKELFIFCEQLLKNIFISYSKYDIKEIMLLTSKGLISLESYKDSIYYGEIYNLLEVIKYYSIDNKILESDDIYKIFVIKDVFNSDIKEIIINIYFKYFQYIKDVKKMIDIDHQYNLYFCTLPQNQINHLRCLIYQRRTLLFIEKSKVLENAFIISNKNIFLFDIYLLYIIGGREFNSEYMDKLIDKGISMIKELDIPNSRLQQFYYYIGKYYMLIEDFLAAIYYLEEALKYSKMNVDVIYIYLLYAYQKSGRSNLSIEANLRFSEKQKLIVNYFVNSRTWGPKDRNDYIMYKIYRNLYIDEILIRIFYKELINLSSTLRNYKDIYLFSEKYINFDLFLTIIKSNM